MLRPPSRPRSPWSRLRPAAAGERGMSLLEIMLVTALLAVVVFPAFQFLLDTQRDEQFTSDSVRQQQDARVGMELFSRQLREANYPEGHTYSDSSLFVRAGDTDVTFYSDVDNNGVVDQVRYYISGSSLMRTLTTPDCSVSPCDYTDPNITVATGTVLSNVRNLDPTACGGAAGDPTTPLFTYYQVDKGTGALTAIVTPTGVITDLLDVSYVKLTLIIDITPGKAPLCQTLDTAVNLRNWRGL